jgi:hypothetical protein
MPETVAAMMKPVECWLSTIARASLEQLDDVTRKLAADYYAGKLSDAEAQRCWEAIDRRRKTRGRPPAPSWPLGRKPQTAAAFGPARSLPCGNFPRDREQWKRQIVADADLSLEAVRLASLLEAKYLRADPRDPFYLHAWPSLKTLARALKYRNQRVLDARLELAARGHIEVMSGRGRKRTTILRVLVKPVENL